MAKTDEYVANALALGRGRGRLTRETLNKLGKVLEAYFDDVRNQGVPDRFKDLLQQYDDRKDDHSGGNAREDRD